jgi:KipI family sensor histidine kinase inhibitor
MNAARIEALGDGALLIRLGDHIDVEINRRTIDLATALRQAQLPGILDVAPAYASVCVRYDPAGWAHGDGERSPYESVTALLGELLHDNEYAGRSAATNDMECIEIPVCYGAEFGPDLGDVAAHAGLEADEVVARHAGADYRVAMLGFMPGFAYLLGLDNKLHTPRRASPRTRVPAGSVAIGGAQTGIYPRELPGGWQLIGRTPQCLFDADREQPALLRPGQPVRFRAIDAGEFAARSR